jgi:hypothetical protein
MVHDLTNRKRVLLPGESGIRRIEEIPTNDP